MYFCDKLSLTNMKQSEISKYSTLWNDFVNIRVNLLEIELKSLFLKLGVNNESISHFFQRFFKFHRNEFAYLPSNGCYWSYFSFSSMDRSISDLKELSAKFLNKSNPICYFTMIWNGIFNMFFKFVVGSAYGFDSEILSIFEKFKNKNSNDNDSDNINNKMKDDLMNAFLSHIYQRFVETSIFGFLNLFEEDNGKKEESMKPKISSIKRLLFDNNEKEFKNFILKYLLGDISNVLNYQLNLSGKYNDINFDYGISNIIVNKFSFAVFHDISHIILLNNNNIKGLLFPKLNKFFKFLFNFCIFSHVNPYWEKNQAYYINEYWFFKDKIFDNVFDLKEKQYQDENPVEPILSNFMGINGTLLHYAIGRGFTQYTEILIKDGHDGDKLDMGWERRTPKDIAKTQNAAKTLSLFKVCILFAFVLSCVHIFFFFVCCLFALSLRLLFCLEFLQMLGSKFQSGF